MEDKFFFMHIPSGITEEVPFTKIIPLGPKYPETLIEKLKMINKWNADGRGLWKYWL